MVAEENHISYSKKARFFTSGNPAKANHVIIALHGYGQLARFFIRKFDILDPEKYFVVCPEGDHRFYLSGTNGKVGASWMTMEDRLTDIENYTKLLDQIIGSIFEANEFETKTLLGFSQGGATASRYIGYGKHKFDRFILWASVFPPDLEQEYYSSFNNSENYFVVGNNDQYYNEERIRQQNEEFEQNQFQFEFVNFEGDHNIDGETLLNILE